MIWLIILAGVVIGGVAGWFFFFRPDTAPPEESISTNTNNNSSVSMNTIELPEPQKNNDISVEEAISERRSIRNYKEDPLSLQQVAQLLWAAQGITDPESGKRTSPSAGALYPLEMYVAASRVKGLEPGVYRYIPVGHQLEKIREGEVREELAEAALGQRAVSLGPAALIIAGDPSVVTAKYGERGEQYTYMEAGHAAQNIYLQAESLGLGTVSIGAFREEKVNRLLEVAESDIPFYIMPVGKYQRDD